MGDFNSHHTLWGCVDTNGKSRTIEKFITKQDLVLLNDKSSTHLYPATASYSSLDLTICSPEIFPDFNWKVVDDLHGSDHLPIQVSEVGPSVQQRPQSWKLLKANWEQFKVQCEQSIHPNAFEDCENPAELFTSLLYSAAEKSNSKHPNKPWFNDDCKKAIAERKSVLRQFNLRPTEENLSKFKVTRAKARRTIKQSKRASWRQYVSRLNSRSVDIERMERRIVNPRTHPFNSLISFSVFRVLCTGSSPLTCSSPLTYRCCHGLPVCIP